MSWFHLFLAGLFEIGWVVGLRSSQGMTRPLPASLTVVALIASLWFLALAMRTLPMGTAYAVWTGIGAVGAVTVGILLHAEPINPLRLGSLALIVAGIIGLKLAAAGSG